MSAQIPEVRSTNELREKWMKPGSDYRFGNFTP